MRFILILYKYIKLFQYLRLQTIIMVKHNEEDESILPF